MQFKQGLESVNGHWLLKFRWQFISHYTQWLSVKGLTSLQHTIGHFGDESFHCTGTDNLRRTTKPQNTQIT